MSLSSLVIYHIIYVNKSKLSNWQQKSENLLAKIPLWTSTTKYCLPLVISINGENALYGCTLIYKHLFAVSDVQLISQNNE